MQTAAEIIVQMNVSGAHIYLNRVSLMNDIIIVQRRNAQWQWVSLDLFLVYLPRGSSTALFQLCFAF